MDVVLYLGRPDLLILACNQHGRDANQLQILLADGHSLQVAINKINGQKEALSLQSELKVNFNDPVYEYATHSLRDQRLVLHIFKGRLVFILRFKVMLPDVLGIFDHFLRVRNLISVALLNSRVQVALNSFLKPLIDLSYPLFLLAFAVTMICIFAFLFNT